LTRRAAFSDVLASAFSRILARTASYILAHAGSRVLGAAETFALVLALALGFATSAACDTPPSAARAAASSWLYGGRIWTDMDGDGLPECGPASPFLHAPGDTIAFDVWIDTESFVWYSFSIYVEWEPVALDFVAAEYVIAGGQNSPPDVWAGGPEAVGFSGWGYSRSGVVHIGCVFLRYVEPLGTCVYPMIDPSYYGEIWSQCNDANYSNTFFFVEGSSSCVDPSQ
jgi:hypothetical protein